jgi:hypothetical protein
MVSQRYSAKHRWTHWKLTSLLLLAIMAGAFLSSPAARARSALAYAYRCPPPPSCTGSLCNPWQCSTFQSGYIVVDTTAHLSAINGNFVTHCFSGRSGSQIPPAWTYSAWIGIGGDGPNKPNGGNLVQTGAAWNGVNYTPFYEFPYFDNGPTYSYFTPIPCNVTVKAEIYQNGSGQFCTWVSWPPYGGLITTVQHCFDNIPLWIPDQTTAQWIDERQTCNSFALESTAWSNGYAYSPERNWHTIAGWPRKAAFMTDLYAAPHILMAPNNPLTSGTAFNDVTTNIVQEPGHVSKGGGFQGAVERPRHRWDGGSLQHA